MRPDQRYWVAGRVYEAIDYFGFGFVHGSMEPGDRFVVGERKGDHFEILTYRHGLLRTSSLAYSVNRVKEIE